MEKKLFSFNYKQNFLHSERNYNKLDEWENTIDLKHMYYQSPKALECSNKR